MGSAAKPSDESLRKGVTRKSDIHYETSAISPCDGVGVLEFGSLRKNMLAVGVHPGNIRWPTGTLLLR